MVIDLETTGLNSSSDEIIELAAIRIINHKIADQLEVLVKTEKGVPKVITELTGITEEILEERGWFFLRRWRSSVNLLEKAQ